MKICLAIAFAVLFTATGLNAEDVFSPQNQPGGSEQAEHPTPESILAEQVQEIAVSPSMSPRTKEKRIASAVRQAVIAATANIADPDRIMKIALDLAQAAAQAAPHFARVIMDAIISIPSIASIPGSLSRLHAAIAAAVVSATGENTGGIPPFGQPSPPHNPELGGGSGDVFVSPSH